MQENELKIFDKNMILNNRVNFDVARQKNLINGEDYSVYALIQSLYLKTLEQYIYSYVDLKKYDDEIANSNLDFGLVPDDRKLAYQKISYMNLKYIYIRNFLFIEKLNINDLETFWGRIKNRNYVIDDELLKIVERTFKDVIDNNFVAGEYKEDFVISYGPANPLTFAKSNDFVINIQYGFNTTKMTDEEYNENLKKKKELIAKIKENIILDLNGLGVNIKIFIRNINDDLTLIYE